MYSKHVGTLTRLGQVPLRVKKHHSGVSDGSFTDICFKKQAAVSFFPVFLGKKIFPRIGVGLESEACCYQSSGVSLSMLRAGSNRALGSHTMVCLCLAVCPLQQAGGSLLADFPDSGVESQEVIKTPGREELSHGPVVKTPTQGAWTSGQETKVQCASGWYQKINK